MGTPLPGVHLLVHRGELRVLPLSFPGLDQGGPQAQPLFVSLRRLYGRGHHTNGPASAGEGRPLA